MSPLLFNNLLKDLDHPMKLAKEMKGIQILKKEAKMLLFANDMTVHIENPKVLTK